MASVFQMAYSLNQSKAKDWTRRLSQLSLAGYLHGGGLLIVYIGSHFAHDQQSSDTAVTVGITCTAIAVGIIAFLCFYACFELRALQKTVSPDSSTGKTLKKIYPIILSGGIVSLNCCLSFSLIPVVPWLRDRTGTVLLLLWLSTAPPLFFGCLHELHQLHKRQAAEKQQRQIMPTSSNNITDTHNSAAQTSTVADTIAATQQALLSSKQSRRDPSASSVLGSGVSLAFLKTFAQENDIDATVTANGAVNAHVKPRTKDIGLDGSGAFVELLGDGKDSSGRPWCGTPTHMLSYSWSYSIHCIIDGLQKLEQERPPSKGKCYYYFIDQFVSIRPAVGF
jgi:hypothetical protein